MLELFKTWANKKLLELPAQGWDGSITQGGISANPSVRLDIDSCSAVGRITLWNSGDVDMEIISIQSEKTVYCRQCHLVEPIFFEKVFFDFFAAFKGL